ncbi:hypothetical protein EsH8_V_000785 [Colletotrichum jinshuiense]
MTDLSQSDIATVAQAVNAHLLRTCALLQTPLSILTLHLALNSADQALAIALHFHRFDLEPRAHLYRGHVLRAWGRWRAAHAAYVRAASARGAGFSGTDIRSLTGECLKMIKLQDEWGEKLRRSRDADRAGKKRKTVRFGDEDESIPNSYSNDDGARSDESSGEIYLVLNGNGEVVGSRDSLPDLRTVRGRSIYRLPTP